TTRTTRPALTRPRAARVSTPTRQDALPREGTETLSAGSRTPTRRRQSPTRPPLRRTPRHHNHCPPTQTEENEVDRSPTTTNRLNAKLEGFGRRSRLDPVKFVWRVAGFAAGYLVSGGR